MKNILITGAGSGIGKDLAIALSGRGYGVHATTETQEQLESLKKEFHQKGHKMQVWKLDVTLPEDREKILNHTIDVLINNAAIGESGSLAEVPLSLIRKSFEVNVFAPIALTQLVLPQMIKRGTGSVIFVSSLAGRAPMPFLNPYSMTKFALSGGVAALKKEIKKIAKEIHIILIEPGTYATGFNQRMLATKYAWMNEHSFFYNNISKMKKEETKQFARIEEKSTVSIVKKIIQAVESNNPKVRYVAPAYQGFFIQLMRMFGR